MKIHLEFSDGKSNKFWKLDQKSKSFTVTYGRVGSSGQSKTKEFASTAKAIEEAEKVIGQKKRKGYSEVGAAVAKKAPAKKKSAPAKKKAAVKKTSQKKASAPAREEAAAKAPAVKRTGNKRTYEFKDAKSHKFWQGTLSGKALTLRYGAWDVAQNSNYGTTKTKSYKDAAEARTALDKACAAKEKAGYELSDPFFSNAERAQIADAAKRGLTSFSLSTHSPEALLLVCQLAKLEDLTISSRQEKLVLPDEIGALSNLRMLSMSSCGLKKLPDSIGELSKLERLSCYSNELTDLPESLGKCTKLKKLITWSNKLTTLPASIGKLVELEELGLKWNRLKSLPREIGGAKKLRELELGDNNLTKLPDELCQLAKLEELEIDKNPITQLPKDFGKLRSLERLSFGQTKIKSLPESLGKIATLVELSVEGYQRMPLSSLPKSLKGHKALTTIEFANCSFKKIPEVLATMPNLESIDFSGNPLHKDLVEIADDKDAVFEKLGWTQAGAVEIRSERLALPDEAEVIRIRQRDKARLEGFRRDAGFIDDEAVAKILAYVSGETDELPKIKADDARHCEGLQKLLCPFVDWSFVQERTLAVCAARWRFKTNTYYSGLYDPFCSWLNKLGDDDTPTLFADIAERLQEYGLSQDEIIMAVFDNARDSLFVDGEVTSIGRYIAKACADKGSEIIEWAKEERAVAPLFEALLREGDVSPFIATFTETVEDDDGVVHAPTGVIHALVNFDAKRYKPLLEKALKETTPDCAPCMADLVRSLVDNYKKKEKKRCLELSQAVLMLISEKQNASDHPFTRISRRAYKTASDMHEHIDWLLSAFGKDAKGMVFEYIENTKVLSLDVIEAAARHLGQDGLPLIAEALNMTLTKGMGTHYQRVFQILRHLDFSAHQEKVWELAACEFPEVQNAATLALSWRPKASLKRAVELLESKTKGERFAGVKVLANIRSKESLAPFAKRILSEKDDGIRDIMVNAVYQRPERVAKKEALNRIASAKERGKLDTWSKKWLAKVKLPALSWQSGGKADIELTRFLVYRQIRHDQYSMDAEARDLIPLIEGKSAGAFAKTLYQAILKNGGVAAKNRPLLSLVGALCDEAMVADLESLGLERNENAIRMLAMTRSTEAARALNHVQRRYQVKYPNIRTAAEEGFFEVAERMELSVDALRDQLVPDLGFTQCSRAVQVGTTEYRARLNAMLKLEFLDAKDTVTKSVPKAASAKTKTELKELGKEVTALAREFRPIIVDWLVTGRKWSSEKWADLFMGNAFMNAASQGLVWGLFHNDELIANFIVNADKTMETLGSGRVSILGPHWVTDFRCMLGMVQPKAFKERKKKLAIQISLAHPIDMPEKERKGWIALLKERSVSGIIPQLDRPVIHPNKAENKARVSYRFENKSIEGDTFKYRATRQGWRRGSVNDGGAVSAYYKRFGDFGIDVFLTMRGLGVGPSEGDAESERLLFVESGSIITGSYTYDEPRDESDERLIPLAKVPMVVFSEAVANVESIMKT